ncbi:hypothetical protein LCGC14_2564490 [marine sediment metagenome]|uniref:Uncharacterized protein n=1 Tax=marine sediment metagenome TaxID=412755 RepID=A0A0F9B6Z2_9ZZZZ
MTDKGMTVSGEVVSVTDWKSGKGAWVNLKDNSNDFFAFKGKVPVVGLTGTWTVKEGTAHMSDKVELVKLLRGPDLKAVAKETADKDMAIVEKSIESGEKTYFARQNLIIRQTCIKSASVAVAGIAYSDDASLWPKVGDRIIELAERLYAWVTESDHKLPEPPEEP